MAKIVISEEQNKAIEIYKKQGSSLQQFTKFSHIWNGPFSPLKSFTVDELARILYEPNSYEVNQLEYIVGEWVTYPNVDQGNNVVKISAIQYAHGRVQFETVSGWRAIRDIKRGATIEEVFWAELGREVGQLKARDNIRLLNGKSHTVGVSICEMDADREFKDGRITGFYPAESFIKFPVGDDSINHTRQGSGY